MDQFERRVSKDSTTEEDSDDHKIITANLYGNTPVPTETAEDRDEEIAQELTADDYNQNVNQQNNSEVGAHVNSMTGWIALILSIASFFFMPIILGGAGVIVGFVAKSKTADTLGNTAIIAGAISIILSLFVLPYL
ncbi:hypothetical protein [Virgibacillus sp. DJP39]|uniref:hypothetical protein n=1 Tax=Virgibacillus sp. DJP39 TaxID=3409790 RepID=UPI003BB73694